MILQPCHRKARVPGPGFSEVPGLPGPPNWPPLGGIPSWVFMGRSLLGSLIWPCPRCPQSLIPFLLLPRMPLLGHPCPCPPLDSLEAFKNTRGACPGKHSRKTCMLILFPSPSLPYNRVPGLLLWLSLFKQFPAYPPALTWQHLGFPGPSAQPISHPKNPGWPWSHSQGPAVTGSPPCPPSLSLPPHHPL